MKLNKLNRLLFCSLSFLLFNGKSFAYDSSSDNRANAELKEIVNSINTIRSNDSSKALILEAVKLISKMDLANASIKLNQALKLNASNANVHFLNGLVYHMMARAGDSKKTELALEGYRQAINFNASNWNAFYFLGLAHYEMQHYVEAQTSFANALILMPEDTEIAMRLVASSYMSGDPTTSCAITNMLMKRLPITDPNFTKVLKFSIPVFASCKQFDLSKKSLAQLRVIDPEDKDFDFLSMRIKGWEVFFTTQDFAPKTQNEALGKFIKTADESAEKKDDPKSDKDTEAASSDSKDEKTAEKKPACGDLSGLPESERNRMVLVDVVLLRTEDTISTTKGVNLLNGLQLLFGSTTGGPAYSRSVNIDASGVSSTTVTRGISVPALAYTLNIADASATLTEVLAKPSLTVMECKKSEFFSGTALTAAVVSSGVGGGAVQIEKKYGVKLGISTEIIQGDQVRLNVEASRTFLQPPSNNVAFTYKVEISEILANANVVLRLGDTLVLGGLSESETDNIRSGVPGLQDIPGVQYLFSQQTQTKFNRSVLMLITPRKASYTWLSDESKLKINSKDPFSPSIDVLRARYGDWFDPFPNLASVFNTINATTLYREFRTGDVSLEEWDRMDTTKQRLKQALGFLYY